MGEKEFGYSHRVNGFGTWDNDHPLRKTVVDHDHYRVLVTYFGQVSDKVDGELFEG